MNEQPKPKNQMIGQMRYWWNVALMARQFEMEVNAPPEDIADTLREFHQPRKGFFVRRSRTAKVEMAENEDTYNFDLRTKRTQRGITYTSVKATGRIVYSEGYKRTIVRGDIRLGWLYMALMLVALLFIIGGLLVGMLTSDATTSNDMTAFLMSSMVMAVFFVIIGRQIYNDYQTLTNTIIDQINDAYREYHIQSNNEIHLEALRELEMMEAQAGHSTS